MSAGNDFAQEIAATLDGVLSADENESLDEWPEEIQEGVAKMATALREGEWTLYGRRGVAEAVVTTLRELIGALEVVDPGRTAPWWGSHGVVSQLETICSTTIRLAELENDADGVYNPISLAFSYAKTLWGAWIESFGAMGQRLFDAIKDPADAAKETTSAVGPLLVLATVLALAVAFARGNLRLPPLKEK